MRRSASLAVFLAVAMALYAAPGFTKPDGATIRPKHQSVGSSYHFACQLMYLVIPVYLDSARRLLTCMLCPHPAGHHEQRGAAELAGSNGTSGGALRSPHPHNTAVQSPKSEGGSFGHVTASMRPPLVQTKLVQAAPYGPLH